ncbi:PTS fructose transporter subunit IIA [Tetragenococcus halophilus subsp. flandriensis]|uniref:BglG family transcription antiterminator n=1 Tax=Tetragenococcus halophilus TaxID=51669 RepID=UPI0023E9B92F|nr:PTS sugar transporter subunit IIA [Tetragenococcus halophilus]GMA08734.1 PTS fructose transporter subunit IIA [Tetragenococcus halophilus subsp. flandriensis]
MNKKITKIMEALLKNNHSLSSNQLAELVNVSPRTIKRYMKVIPESFNTFNISFQIISDKNGYRIEIGQEQRMKLVEALASADETSEGIENNNNIFLYLVLENEVTLENIADYFFYSKNTIVKKVNNLRNEVDRFDLEIIRSSKGLKVVGNESSIRKAMVEFLDIESEQCRTIVEEYFQKEKFINQIYQIIIDELIKANVSFSQEQILLILKNILVLLLRTQYTTEFNYENEPLIYKNYVIIKNISRQIQESFQLKLTETDLFYLSILFGTSVFTEEKEREIRVAIFYSLEKLEKSYNENFLDNSRFMKILQKHVMICIQRVTVDVSIQNPLKEMIKNKYYLAYEYALFFANELSKLLSLKFSDEEISYFALHFQTYIEEKKEEEMYRAIVVCENGVGTSSLVRMQLEARFPSLKVKKVIPRYLIDKQDFKEIDLIISTHHINKNLPKEVIYVNSVLSEKDFETVHTYLRSAMSTSYLKNLFNEDLFAVDVQLENREDVIQFVSNILCGKGLMKSTDSKHIIDREEYASTDIISEVAIPHFVTSKPSFIYFMKLKKPIFWSDDEVSYVFFGGINVKEKESKKIFPYLIKKLQQEGIKEQLAEIYTFDQLINLLIEN